jgi:hypothetical protein
MKGRDNTMLRGGEKEGTSRPTAPDPVVRMGEGFERVVCLLKGIAEGTYKTKHAEAAKLYYTTMYPHTQTLTQTCTGLYGGRQASSFRDIAHARSVTSGSSCPGFANWDEEAIQALRWAIRAGVTRGELGGEPQSSSSSLEATSDGAAELSEGGEGGHGSSSSGQEPSEVARD